MDAFLGSRDRRYKSGNPARFSNALETNWRFPMIATITYRRVGHSLGLVRRVLAPVKDFLARAQEEPEQASLVVWIVA